VATKTFGSPSSNFRPRLPLLSPPRANRCSKWGKDITKIGKVLETVSLVASLMDKVLNLAA
jgi:hypothetical protein